MTPSRLLPLLAACAAVPMCAGLAVQVPEGSAVVCTYTVPNSSSTSGLFFVPLAGGPTTTVTGLPPELATSGVGLEGCWAP